MRQPKSLNKVEQRVVCEQLLPQLSTHYMLRYRELMTELAVKNELDLLLRLFNRLAGEKFKGVLAALSFTFILHCSLISSPHLHVLTGW